jgi:predicted O-methyltransferase YrrM
MGFSTLTSLGRALAYRANSLVMAENARSAYLSFKHGIVDAADSILQNKDPVFGVIDWESLSLELNYDVTIPATPFSRSTSLLEKLCLATLLKLDNPETIFEFGTYRGATTLLLLKNAPEQTRLFTFDIPSDIDKSASLDRTRLINLQESGLKDDFFRESLPRSDRVTQVYADLLKVDWKYIRELPRPAFVFIDANHSYEGCYRDTRNIIDWVGDEATIVWHDASWRSFIYVENKYGVHRSIVDATSPQARDYTFRIKDTTLMVRSRRQQALFKRHLRGA